MSRRASTGRQQGFSLLEVMIAMLVLGVAVLGFAGLQVSALQSTGTAHVRSQAMSLAAEMTERIRGNPTAIATYVNAANWGAATVPAGEPSTWASTCVTTNTNNNGCTPAAMALFDIQEVQFLARQLLPAGTVRVAGAAAGGGCSAQVTCVRVAWAGVDATTAACVNNASPNCVEMRVFVR